MTFCPPAMLMKTSNLFCISRDVHEDKCSYRQNRRWDMNKAKDIGEANEGGSAQATHSSPVARGNYEWTTWQNAGASGDVIDK